MNLPEQPTCSVTSASVSYAAVDSFMVGRGSSIGIATCYGLDGPGIESRHGGGEIFRTRPDRSWGLPSLLRHGYRFFPGG